MEILHGRNPVCKEICQALGLDTTQVKGIDLRMRAGEIVTINVESFPTISQVGGLVPLLEEFVLLPRGDWDQWEEHRKMRERIEDEDEVNQT